VSESVGLIGLGIMGSAMTSHMIAAGLSVVGYDIDAGKLQAFAAAGGDPAHSPREVAQRANVVLTVLPSGTILQEVVAGENGLVGAGNHDLLLADCGTFDLADKERTRATLVAARMQMLDCTISGTGSQARQKDVVVYASGEPAAFDRCTSIFAGFARASHYVGAFGNGSKMKYVANLLVAIHNVAAAEALVLARRAGLDPALVYEMIRIGAGTSRMFEVRGPMMVAGRYDQDVTSRIDLWQKDMQVIGRYARELDCPVPLFSVCAQLYSAAMANDLAKLDTAAVCMVLESLAGIRRPAQ